MTERDESCTFDALLTGEENGCLRLVIGEIVLFVEKALVLQIEEIEWTTETVFCAPVRVKVACAGSVRRIEPTGPLTQGLSQDPFAISSRSLWSAVELRSARNASPAYQAMAERFLDSRGIRLKIQ